jgi:23S rRNA (pseudouridine1915-N3)-methyltransferase
MKITIISIGKFEKHLQKPIFDDYLKRLKWNINLKELEAKVSSKISGEALKNKEGEVILANIKDSSKIIALDENGKQHKSRAFAKIISDSALQGNSHLTFIIGGANGLSQAVLNKANLKISLGLMTFPHMMVRSILIEQIYRAFTIANNHPYHRD